MKTNFKIAIINVDYANLPSASTFFENFFNGIEINIDIGIEKSETLKTNCNCAVIVTSKTMTDLIDFVIVRRQSFLSLRLPLRSLLISI